MRLKVTLERGHGRPAADVLVDVDASASVGALARYFARSDPEGTAESDRDHTLAYPGPAGRHIRADTPVSASGLQSGAVLSLAPTGGQFAAAAAAAAAAVIVVQEGPDTGREFPIPAGTSVIGRGNDSDVVLTDPMVSRHHARVTVGDTIEVVDLGSANGIVVGGEQAERALLRPGDSVLIGDTLLTARLVSSGGHAPADPCSIPFNRPPRLDPIYRGQEFKAPEPPDPPKTQRFPMLPLFAPLLIGVVVYLSTKSTISLIFMGLSPLMMIANVAEGRLAGRKAYREAVELFRADIEDLVSEATVAREEEARRRRGEHPPAVECIQAVDGLTAVLWCRWPDLPGFGELRLGLGRQPSRNTIELSSGKQNNRALWRELREAIGPFATVDDVPVVTRLSDKGAVGVGGPRAQALDVARGLVLQVAGLHSPADVSLAVISTPEAAGDWEWVKWLPHCLAPSSPLSTEPLASTPDSCQKLVADLERIVNEAPGEDKVQKASPSTRILVIVEDGAPMERSRLTRLAAAGAAAGVHLLWVASDLSRLPAACRSYVEVATVSGHSAAGFVHTGEEVLPLQLEPVPAASAEAVARKLAPVVDAASGMDAQSDLPRSVSLLSLGGRELASSPDAVIERWVENRSILIGPYAHTSGGARRPANLRAVVGATSAGPHVLDLRTHGPHALVGGTTGSGKSELLQSWILGMALTNSPQRLTFLLVDYKGGSAFSDCVRLPHTVGLVTDLSPHLVRRALTSLAAELRYREGILHRKGAKDLATLERDGDPEAPPSLVIVVDEFAALVQEVPEFVDGVVNVAQRGRSLGLHLILATQRPSGVIKDNLRANTNLRLALRMADDADSTDVIGTQEAAGFDPGLPGRAVSRTGPTQLTPFQAAYVGGWTSDTPSLPSIEVSTFGLTPSLTWDPPDDLVEQDPAHGPTDIQRIVGNISQANRQSEMGTPRLPWLSELAPVYELTKLPTSRRDDALVFAVADDPEHQAQPTVSFRPDDDGNMAVYGTGNAGKSAFLPAPIAVAAGFTVRGGPCRVYGLDFGARGLQMLEELPHVGSIVSGGDHERLTRLLTMLRGAIDERAARYSKAGAGSITDYRRQSGDADEPRIFLLVDGMGTFRTNYEGTEHARWFETFLGIAADGRQVGVHVILSADRMGALPTALASLVQRRIVLRLADANDYAMMGLPSDVLDSKSPPGRALFEGAEVQVSVLGASPDVMVQARAMKEFGGAMRKAGYPVAPPIERLADWVSLDELPVSVDGRPSLGISGVSLRPVGFEPTGTFTVAGPPGSGRTTTLMSVVASLKRWQPNARLVYFGNKRSPLALAVAWERAALDAQSGSELAPEIASSLGEADGSGPPCAVVIEGIADFVNSPADYPMQEMVKAVLGNGHFVLSDGEPNVLGGSYPLLVAARGGRAGIVLQPEQTDANLLRTQFPRIRRVEFPVGRGLAVAHGGPPEVVQVAVAGGDFSPLSRTDGHRTLSREQNNQPIKEGTSQP